MPLSFEDPSILILCLPLPPSTRIIECPESGVAGAIVITYSDPPIGSTVGPLAFDDLRIAYQSPNAVSSAVLVYLADVDPITFLDGFDGETEVDGDGRLRLDLLQRQGPLLPPLGEGFLGHRWPERGWVSVKDFSEYSFLKIIFWGLTFLSFCCPLLLQGLPLLLQLVEVFLSFFESGEGLLGGLDYFVGSGRRYGQGITQRPLGPRRDNPGRSLLAVFVRAEGEALEGGTGEEAEGADQVGAALALERHYSCFLAVKAIGW